MKWNYVSRQEANWDGLADDIYGSEKLAYILLRANPQYHDLIYLPAGLTLTVVETPSRVSTNPAPPWIRNAG